MARIEAMIDSETQEALIALFGRRVRFNEPLSRHTSLGVGGPASVYIEPDNLDGLIRMIQWSREHQLPFMVFGGGTNLLVLDEGFSGVVITLSRCLKGISQVRSADGSFLVTALAGTPMKSLCAYAIDRGLSGMNFALGIPGTVGGGIVMNAGTSHGRVEEVLARIRVLHPSGKREDIDRKDLNFGYRSMSWEQGNRRGEGAQVIVSGSFSLFPADPEEMRRAARRILGDRREKQPLDAPSAGCFFKNPVSGKPAGELIDMAGLKGKQIGGAAVSEKHANFFINKGNATAGDFLALMTHVRDTVSRLFNVELETEVKIVGT